MRIKHFKNKFIRAFIFCSTSTFLVTKLIPYEDTASALAVVLMTSSILWIFNNEEMIDLVGKRSYRFSFLRLIFNAESFLYSVLPSSLKAHTVFILTFIFSGTFMIFLGEAWLLFVYGGTLFIYFFLFKFIK